MLEEPSESLEILIFEAPPFVQEVIHISGTLPAYGEDW